MVPACKFLEPGRQRCANHLLIAPLGRKQPRARRGREGNGTLEFRIIAAAGPLEGIRPSMVENILALAVALDVAGKASAQGTVRFLDQQMLTEPARFGCCRSRFLQRRKVGMRNEGIIGRAGLPLRGAGKPAPACRRYRGERMFYADVDRLCHAPMKSWSPADRSPRRSSDRHWRRYAPGPVCPVPSR